ncbi:MAG: hypothetical protein OEV92_00205 [Nitrospinota bacterium]|nr:hypothetical protein [Nitrospinota bacterium]
MKNGKCPKCQGTEVYKSRHDDLNQTGTISDGAVCFRVIGSGWFGLSLYCPAHYLCLDCGYSETYLLDKEAPNKVRASTNWSKV